jgi:hypothetical protein
LYNWGFNVDGWATFAVEPYEGPDYTLGQYEDLESRGVDLAGFDWPRGEGDESGTGTVFIVVSGEGAHHAGMFIDLEIDESVNTRVNETVTTSGTAAAGQSYEGDEPGYGVPFGDIASNFRNRTLDNSVLAEANDHAMALAWDFTLRAGEVALITFLVSDADALDGIVLSHNDPDSAESYLFSSRLEITEPVLLFENDVVVGARGINVQGTLFQVEFIDGSCIELLEGCDEPGDFPFGSANEAKAASAALQTLFYRQGYAIRGCDPKYVCEVLTPIDLTSPPGMFRADSLFVWGPSCTGHCAEQYGWQYPGRESDLTNQEDMVYAIWKLEDPEESAGPSGVLQRVLIPWLNNN